MSQKLEGEHRNLNVIMQSPNNGSYAIFDQKFNDSILQKADNYVLAIDRFRIPMTGIPIFIFDQSVNAYTVQIGYGGLYGPRTAVSYITTSPTLPITDPHYWWVFTFDIFLKMVNNALQTAFTNSIIPLTLPVGSKAPFFSINLTTGLLSFNAQNTFYDLDLATPIEVYLNQTLWRFFDGIPIIQVGSVTSIPSVSGRDARMIVFNTFDNLITYGSVPNNTYYKMESDNGFESAATWNIAKGFFFRSNNIPVRTEIMPTLQYTGTGQQVVNNYVNGQPIICNFDFVYDASSLKPIIAQYILNTPYKVIDIISSENLRSIDIQVFWYDKYNNIYPLYILPGEAMSLRFVFMKK
jgi:hypothetical protein